MLENKLKNLSYSEPIASSGLTTMGFSAEKRLEETLKNLEANDENGKKCLEKLYASIKIFHQMLAKQHLSKDEINFRWNLAVYTLGILAELHAPTPVLAAGFLLDIYLRLTSVQEIENFPIDEQIRPFLKNASALYKYEMQLSWRRTIKSSDFEEEALRFLRRRAIADSALPEGNIQSAKKQHENHCKLLAALAETPEVLIIKLADRISVLKFLKPGSAFLRLEDDTLLNHLAAETLNIHVPLAERLGIWWLKWPLQDLAFRIDKPKEYQKIHEEMAITRQTRERLLSELIKAVSAELQNYGIKSVKVQGRSKSIYSIYQKKETKNVEIDKMNDLTGIRIIIESDKTEDCYSVLDCLLSNYDPPVDENKKGIYDDGKFSRDWIVHPKSNGYQSIHTTILCQFSEEKEQLVEVQIRTIGMHEVAEYGIAAHWLYKEKAKFLPQISKNDELWNAEQVKSNYNNQLQLKKKSAFFEQEIFCLTPKGEVLDFHKNATPIDFAYRIHESIGNRIQNIKVNNKIASFNYELKNADIIEVATSKIEKGPREEWLRRDKELVKERYTLSKIHRWLRKHTA